MLLISADADDLGFRKFQWAPTLGGECYMGFGAPTRIIVDHGFNGHPPLGVNATRYGAARGRAPSRAGFNGHPPLGVNATYVKRPVTGAKLVLTVFQWAPTLGGECYPYHLACSCAYTPQTRFNGHPPLGVNATLARCRAARRVPRGFQWAPTLGGECYWLCRLLCGCTL